jgi:hypothetical protein
MHPGAPACAYPELLGKQLDGWEPLLILPNLQNQTAMLLERLRQPDWAEPPIAMLWIGHNDFTVRTFKQ